MKTILDLSNTEAQAFFFRKEIYCNIDLPPYFDFQPLLDKLSQIGKLKTLPFDKAKSYDDVNYRMYNNKDGFFSWRPLQLINPAIYAYLVYIVTQDGVWNLIQERFREFQENKNICCCSIPLAVAEDRTNAKKEDTILHWWEEVEQKSIEYALDYSCMLITDITNCYGSIYTHTIPWALHEKDVIKVAHFSKGIKTKYVGNEIDSIIRSMSYGQTNGIPQGSVLMDFVAEIVLGYADLELSRSIEKYNIEQHQEQNKIQEYKIIRYRDDYRIFANSQNDVVKIAKLLTEVLQKLNLKINTQKTFVSNEIIRDSIKPDKFYWNEVKQKESSLQKQLLLIYALSLKYPNTGTLEKVLNELYDRLYPLSILKSEDHIKVMVSIIADIMQKSPRVYAIACAILAKLLSLEMNNQTKMDIYNSIQKKFKMIPNAGYLQVWLQRITIKADIDISFTEPLCKRVIDEGEKIWNLDWLQEDIKQVFADNSIINQAILQELPAIPEPQEVKTISHSS